MLALTKAIQPSYGAEKFGSLALAALPVAFAAAGQTIVVLTGGIDLSIGSVMALTSVSAAVLMQRSSDEFAIIVVILVLGTGLTVGATNGALRGADTRPGHNRDARDALRMGGRRPACAGGARRVGSALATWDLIVGPIGSEWVPKALILLVVSVSVVWNPSVVATSVCRYTRWVVTAWPPFEVVSASTRPRSPHTR